VRSLYKHSRNFRFYYKFNGIGLFKKLNVSTGDKSKYDRVQSKRVLKPKVKSRKLRAVSKTPKKRSFSHLTKKQRAKVRFSKVHKLVQPGTELFNKYRRLTRDTFITDAMIGSKFLVHDGYS